MSQAIKPINQAGLAGITAGKTAISTVGKEGVGLTYRGYSIEDLAEKAKEIKLEFDLKLKAEEEKKKELETKLEEEKDTEETATTPEEKQKCIEKGLINPDAQLTEEEIDNFIFLPVMFLSI